MARTSLPWAEFQVLHTFEFASLMRGHHVYHEQWAAIRGTVLTSCPDPEAANYDATAVGIYNSGSLVGHAPAVLSKTLHDFITKDGNRIEGVVTGKRKREVGMVLPIKYKAYTPRKQHAIILSKLLEKCKEDHPGFELTFDPINDSHAFAIYN